VLETFERAPWPGNVRQLENALERLSLLAGDGPIGRELLGRDPALASLVRVERPEPAPLSLERSEADRIRSALEACGGNRTRAARMLGISRATLYRRLAELA